MFRFDIHAFKALISKPFSCHMMSLALSGLQQSLVILGLKIKRTLNFKKIDRSSICLLMMHVFLYLLSVSVMTLRDRVKAKVLVFYSNQQGRESVSIQLRSFYSTR